MKPIEIAKWSAIVLDEGAALVVIVGCNWLLWDGTRFECEYRYDYYAWCWIEKLPDPDGSVTVGGVKFRPAPDFGAWYEWDDPNPSGSVGRLHMPMFQDGSPDTRNISTIEVAYEDA